LKQPLDIIPIRPDFLDEKIDSCFSDENFNYLLECAVNYAALLGKTIEIPASKTHERVNKLYHRFAEILPDGHNLNFEINENRLKWLIYHVHDWDCHTLFWMPVGFINRLSGRFKEIAMSFMNLFIRKNGLTRFKYSYEYEFFFDCSEESIHYSDFDDSEKQKIYELLESYRSGKISLFLDAIYDHKPVNIVKELKEYAPLCSKEAKLLECFRKGLLFISGQEMIMNYDYDSQTELCFEEYEDSFPLTLDRIIRYLYDLDDFVSNELVTINNQCLQESYSVTPTSFLILRPDSELFIPGDYPERFSEWFCEMMQIITSP